MSVNLQELLGVRLTQALLVIQVCRNDRIWHCREVRFADHLVLGNKYVLIYLHRHRVDRTAQGNSYAKTNVNFRGTCSCDSVVFTMLRTLILASLSVVLLLPLRSLAAKETKLYDALGVPPDSDENVIKKAYRKAAL
jgi:hypothetical protein